LVSLGQDRIILSSTLTMGPGGASHPAEYVIRPSIVGTMKTGTFLLASRCVDQPAGEPFAIACGTTATTATMGDAMVQKCLDEDNLHCDICIVFIVFVFRGRRSLRRGYGRD
jgi:hypothetical protein